MEETRVDLDRTIVDFDDELGRGFTKVKILVFMVLFSPLFSTAFIFLAFSDFNLLYFIAIIGVLGITLTILLRYEKSSIPNNETFDHLR